MEPHHASVLCTSDGFAPCGHGFAVLTNIWSELQWGQHSAVTILALGSKRSQLNAQLCYLIAVRSWANYLSFLDICFLMRSVGEI